MYKIILTLIVSLCLTCIGFAQCGKNVRITVSKTYQVENGNKHEAPLEAFIDLTGEEITISGKINGTTSIIKNHINEVSFCKWKKFLYNGKAEYKVTTHFDDKPESIKSTITVESIDGEISITCQMEKDESHQLQFVATEFEEL